MKRTLLALVVSGTLSTAAFAGNHASDNTWQDSAMDAWIDGKAEATLLFNGNLDSFDINTDVDNGVVTLTGKVDSSVDKKLAEELIVGIVGVSSVENDLTILETSEEDKSSDAMSSLTDAKIATVVKSRLIFDTDISGTDINVDVDNGNVMLKGEVDSDAERDLAIEIAKNASDVRDVMSELVVVSDSE